MFLCDVSIKWRLGADQPLFWSCLRTLNVFSHSYWQVTAKEVHIMTFKSRITAKPELVEQFAQVCITFRAISLLRLCLFALCSSARSCWQIHGSVPVGVPTTQPSPTLTYWKYGNKRRMTEWSSHIVLQGHAIF